ncbi:MAG: IS3 family transposase [Candidatus Electrothrix scaldis]|nr:MAG: IS3 family transposase [Candidatus Electrothrix sp. GW3-3]
MPFNNTYSLNKIVRCQIYNCWVRAIRQRHPRMGGRKLHYELQDSMAALGISRGRDAFFKLLSAHNLLVPTRLSHRKTTHAGLWRCPNLLIDLTITHVHQAWVGDITYITTETGFVYLALLTDVFSRFIVGFDLSSSLAVEGCDRALKQAIAQADGADLRGLIHHSDHGVQYTAWLYRERLQKMEIRSSMGEVGNCYENALAERVNGILKGEYGLDDLFIDKEHAQKAVREAVWLYNYERPHLALNYGKPAEIYFEKIDVK